MLGLFIFARKVQSFFSAQREPFVLGFGCVDNYKAILQAGAHESLWHRSAPPLYNEEDREALRQKADTYQLPYK